MNASKMTHEDVSFRCLTVAHENGADSQQFYNALEKLKHGKILTKDEYNIGVVTTVQHYHEQKISQGLTYFIKTI